MFPYDMESEGEHRPFITLILIGVMSVLFGLTWYLLRQSAIEDISVALSWFEYGVLPADFKWHTPVTSLFFHASLFHWFFNMLYLWIYGSCMERRVGTALYLPLFFLFSYVANWGFLAMTPPYLTHQPSIGSSAAIAGIMGFVMIVEPTAKVVFFTILRPNRFTLPAILVLVVWFLGQVFSGFQSIENPNGINHWAHIFGFIGGVVTGVAYRYLVMDRSSVERLRAYDFIQSITNRYTKDPLHEIDQSFNEYLKEKSSPRDEERLEKIRLDALRGKTDQAVSEGVAFGNELIEKEDERLFVQLMAILSSICPDGLPEEFYRVAGLYFATHNAPELSVYYRFKQYTITSDDEMKQRLLYIIGDTLVQKLNRFTEGVSVLEKYLSLYPDGVVSKEARFSIELAGRIADRQRTVNG